MKTETLPALAICYMTHPKIKGYPLMYVSHLPGECGVDWGYTQHSRGTPQWQPGKVIGEATLQFLDCPKPLNRYWQRRFRKNCRDTGMTFHSLPCWTTEEVIAAMEKLLACVRARHPELPSGSEIDWMTPEERSDLHHLKLQLPTPGQERAAARQRLDAKRAARHSRLTAVS